MALMIVIMRMAIGMWWDDAGTPQLSDAFPQVVVFLLLTVSAIVGLEWTRREANEPKPPRLAWVGLLLAGAIVGVLVGHFAWTFTGRAALRREITTLEEDGLAPPMPSGQPSLAEADNAVPLLLKAAAEFTKTAGPSDAGSEPQKALHAYFERFNDSGVAGEERAEVAKLLEAQKASIDLVMQAADRKGAEWALDFSPPVLEMQLPDHVSLQNIAKLLSVQAIERAQSGDTAGAAQSIRAGLAMGHAIGASPLMISQLFRASTHSIVLNTGRRIFDTPAELAIAEPLWAPYLDGNDLLEDAKTSMRLDFVSLPREMASGVAGGPAESFPETGSMIERAGSAPVYYFGMASILRDERPLFEALAPGKPGAPALPENAPKYIARAAMAAARLEIAKSALAWSKAPGDPTKGIGTDPFGGAPLRAVATSGGTLIFSIGPDMKDDGGAKFDNDKMTGDLSWLILPDAPAPSTVTAKSK